MNLAERLAADQTIFTAWSGIPDPLVAEFSARAGFDAVTLDMQHGCHSTDSVMRCISAVALAATPAVVRIPVGRFDMASRALDFGAAGVIAPMVNSVADAEALAEATKYPPLGGRSWGPTRVMALAGRSDGPAYLREANKESVAIAMIETRAALAAADAIMGVEGIDGIFVGPSDLSVALSDGAQIAAEDEDMLMVAKGLADRARALGKFAGIFAFSGEAGRRYAGMGFRFIALASDFNYITAGAKALLAKARE
jgi:4-hydroxy-2-oxoheptanedioate aldolase